MPDDQIRFGYLGYSTVTRDILDGINVDPVLTISFVESVEEEYGRGVTYDGYSPTINVETINSERAKRAIKDHDIDVLLVMGWPELLNPELLDAPNTGCVGRHLSLLPKRRGRTPVAWALIHGLKKTGVSLFWLDEGVDSGPIIGQREVPIARDDHAQELHDKCTEASIALLNEEVLPTFRAGGAPETEQDGSEATYTHPRRPDMGLIDWTNSAWSVHNFVRGQSHPYPGAFTYYQMGKVTVWRSEVANETGTKAPSGTVLESSDDGTELRVQCGEGSVDVEVEHVGDIGSIEPNDRLGAIPH
jgi:methionyl-tRNA formyltransferase